MKSIILIQIVLLVAMVPKLQAQQKNEHKLHVIIIRAIIPSDADGAEAFISGRSLDVMY